MARVGGRLVTSEEALIRFFDAVDADAPAAPTARRQASPKRAARAEARLRAGGF